MTEVDKVMAGIKPVEKKHEETIQARLDRLTKPPRSLGRLEEFAQRLVAINGGRPQRGLKKKAFVFAGDHGVAAEGVSAYPAEVTRQMVMNFLRGGAAISVLARHAGAEVVVIDVGVRGEFPEAEHLVKRKAVPGTRNMVREAAMTRTEALQCLGTGIAMARRYAVPGPALYAAGEMGIGNTTAAAAITAIVTGEPARVVTGRGTGIDDRTLEKKIRLVERAIEVNRPDPQDPLDVLSKVGGAEIGAIAGLCLGAAERGIPVVLDGFISTSGALIACGLNRYVKDFLFAAHQSPEPGHQAALAHLGLRPIFDLDLRLGEGTGAVLAMHLLEAALKILTEMATFEEAGVSDQG